MEQPSNSWLPRFPPVLHALADCNCEKIVTFLGSFSEELGIPKPIQLWSNAVYCRHLYRRKVEKDPARRSFYYTQSFDEYTGAAGLKSSGAYPYEFGEAVVKYHLQYNIAQELPPHQAWLENKDCVHSVASIVLSSNAVCPFPQGIEEGLENDDDDDGAATHVHLQAY